MLKLRNLKSFALLYTRKKRVSFYDSFISVILILQVCMSKKKKQWRSLLMNLQLIIKILSPLVSIACTLMQRLKLLPVEQILYEWSLPNFILFIDFFSSNIFFLSYLIHFFRWARYKILSAIGKCCQNQKSANSIKFSILQIRV